MEVNVKVIIITVQMLTIHLKGINNAEERIQGNQ